MNLILTRPLADAQPLAKKLRQRGHVVQLAPLLKIVPREALEFPDSVWQAICFSSANAVIGPQLNQLRRNIPVYCVGPQSAAVAAATGFQDVRPRGGNMQGLLSALLAECSPAKGPILYVSGSETTGDLQGQLQSAGFVCQRIITYDAISQKPPLTQSDLAAADGVLLYSARTARLWHAFASPYLGDAPKHPIHFCLSQNVANQLPHAWRRKIAEAATEDHMLSLLDHDGEAE
jgi:uroporphyrinogen-III synthase